MNDVSKDKIKDKTAIALEYDPNVDEAPKVLATGKGLVAEKNNCGGKEVGRAGA